MEQDQWAKMRPARQPTSRDTGFPAELSAARSAIKRKLHVNVCPDEDRSQDGAAPEQPEAPNTPPAQLQQQPMTAASHLDAQEAPPLPAELQLAGQEASPPTAAAATEIPLPGAPAAANKQTDAAVSAAASRVTIEPSSARTVTFAPEPVPDEAAAAAVAPAPQAPVTIATAAADTAARPPAKHAPGIPTAAVGPKTSADAEELLPEPKAPTGRLQPASKWQDNDAFEAHGEQRLLLCDATQAVLHQHRDQLCNS